MGEPTHPCLGFLVRMSGGSPHHAGNCFSGFSRRASTTPALESSQESEQDVPRFRNLQVDLSEVTTVLSSFGEAESAIRERDRDLTDRDFEGEVFGAGDVPSAPASEYGDDPDEDIPIPELHITTSQGLEITPFIDNGNIPSPSLILSTNSSQAVQVESELVSLPNSHTSVEKGSDEVPKVHVSPLSSFEAVSPKDLDPEQVKSSRVHGKHEPLGLSPNGPAVSKAMPVVAEDDHALVSIPEEEPLTFNLNERLHRLGFKVWRKREFVVESKSIFRKKNGVMREVAKIDDVSEVRQRPAPKGSSGGSVLEVVLLPSMSRSPVGSKRSPKSLLLYAPSKNDAEKLMERLSSGVQKPSRVKL
mmetsp:Transcript_4060/g.6265  ORF Transcript_4060/g.6265 Transcript_4060/m.6265 type:complete len:360 (-) Transcript_4060:344-1423(-)|eukprot:CAMPEP_0184659782 /NCGR_PEP_ID=MMETSP0308-20130426/31053_1 /TAXON_ID=38269 /ORGANISM="Gloeochaete witrockiana, Strain SAG 46.84" /LENGTH=359 /DNA_ID=CAMNT_0027099865 /DNA_START=52 /DNA_END=1131 /DNA_ORIENTATION=+